MKPAACEKGHQQVCIQQSAAPEDRFMSSLLRRLLPVLFFRCAGGDTAGDGEGVRFGDSCPTSTSAILDQYPGRNRKRNQIMGNGVKVWRSCVKWMCDQVHPEVRLTRDGACSCQVAISAMVNAYQRKGSGAVPRRDEAKSEPRDPDCIDGIAENSRPCVEISEHAAASSVRKHYADE